MNEDGVAGDAGTPQKNEPWPETFAVFRGLRGRDTLSQQGEENEVHRKAAERTSDEDDFQPTCQSFLIHIYHLWPHCITMGFVSQ